MMDHPCAKARRISSSIERTLPACSCVLGTGRNSVSTESCRIDIEFRPMPRTYEQDGRVRSMELEIRLALAQGWSILRTPPKICSQFDPAIDKERKFISNLGRNVPMLPDYPECAALRADMKGDRLNSRFQHIYKNKSVKAHGVV